MNTTIIYLLRLVAFVAIFAAIITTVIIESSGAALLFIIFIYWIVDAINTLLPIRE
jgi:hypothetical protein